MTITTRCTNCAARLAVKESLLGRKVKCPKCGKVTELRDPGADAASPASPPNNSFDDDAPGTDDWEDENWENDAGDEWEDEALHDPWASPAPVPTAPPAPTGSPARRPAPAAPKEPAKKPILIFVGLGCGSLLLFAIVAGALIFWLTTDSDPHARN
ncbi:MAG: hypothetical protein KDA85_09600, partial [Planctomycetaceae bacterium]|nr:hypothetical protein [Planctomycetaceae bacterium]